MAKKCIVCNEEEAKYKIKDTSDYYCKECAVENFADLAMLLKVDEEVTRLKEAIKERLEEELKARENQNVQQSNQDREN
jgi:hypothetical protein